MNAAVLRLAIDVGGTFTDVVLIDAATGKIWFEKVLSTPADPSLGSLQGAQTILSQSGAEADSVDEVVHATTVATNAVLERKGARAGLITTAGFRDALEMGREARYDIYDLGIALPPPLVPRARRVEVKERVGYDGEVIQALDLDEVHAVIDQLVVDAGVEALAVCLLHGYAHPAHETIVAKAAMERHPGISVSVSHEIAPEIREFERVSTTVVDAYVKPLVRRYVGRLNDGIRALGVERDLAMMLSHGGIGPATEVAEKFPIRMIESGPAAGAIAAAQFARATLARPDALAFDMGGTTAKISVIRDGAPTTTNAFEVGHVRRFKRGSGYPLQISAVELIEIGAGGGSIAHVNELGLLKVGPESAGAEPGPMCYGRGGEHPTVTDADLFLGYLDPHHFLGGAMVLDKAHAKDGMATLAKQLGMSVTQVAFGIHDIVNESMAAATRTHAAESGIDLRRYAMIAFGGAGPVHAYELARKLGLRRIVCPFGAGVASAIGCLAAPPSIELATPYFGALSELDDSLADARFTDLRERGKAALVQLIGVRSPVSEHRFVDLRCEGQGYAITIPVPDGVEGLPEATLRAGYTLRYGEIYGHSPPAVELEVVGLRSRISSTRPGLSFTPLTGSAEGATAPKTHRPVYFEHAGGYVTTAVYDRHQLHVGETYRGPAIIEERETSIITGPDTRFTIDDAANVIIDFAA